MSKTTVAAGLLAAAASLAVATAVPAHAGEIPVLTSVKVASAVVTAPGTESVTLKTSACATDVKVYATLGGDLWGKPYWSGVNHAHSRVFTVKIHLPASALRGKWAVAYEQFTACDSSQIGVPLEYAQPAPFRVK